MTEDEFRDLLERSQQIQELTQHPGWELFVDRAHATMATRQMRVLNGGPSSFDDYRKDVGFLEGAQFVLDVPKLVEAQVDHERMLSREADE